MGEEHGNNWGGEGERKQKFLHGFGEKIWKKETTWKTQTQRTTLNVLKNRMGCDMDCLGPERQASLKKTENQVAQNAEISSQDEKILASGEGLCPLELSYIFFF